VDRPGLLPGEIEALHQPRHPALTVPDAEAALDQGAQVAEAPRHAAVALQLRTPEDQGLERRLAALVQAARATGPRPVAQARDTLGVVAVDPVPERLPRHPGEPGRLLAPQAVQRVGQREQAGAEAAGRPARGGQAGAARPGCGRRGSAEAQA
jgi:hypothetical protein